LLNSTFSALGIEMAKKKKVDLRKNSRLWCSAFILLLLMVGLRFVYLQVFSHKYYLGKAVGQHVQEMTIHAEHGKIYDTKMKALAYDDYTYDLYIDESMFYDSDFTIELLAANFGLTTDEIQEKLNTRVLATHLHQDKADILKRFAINNPLFDAMKVTESGKRETLIFTLNPNGSEEENTSDPKVTELTKNDIRLLKVICGFGDENTEIEKAYNNFIERNKEERKYSLSVAITENAPVGAMKQIRLAEINGITALEYQGYRVTINKNLFRAASATTRKSALETIAPVIGLTIETLENRLIGPSKYIVLKNNLSKSEEEALNSLQSTVFVTDPGKYYRSLSGDERMNKLDYNAQSIYNIIHGVRTGDKVENEQVDIETIRKSMLTDAKKGAAYTAFNSKGESNVLVQRRVTLIFDTEDFKGGICYGLPGVSTNKIVRRIYPYGDMAAPILGWPAASGKDSFGIEKTYEDILRGVDGKETRERTSKNRAIPELTKAQSHPIDGYDVQLTIDTSIQQVAETALKKAVLGKSIGGQCVVLNSATGEILALVNLPSWDANDPGKAKTDYIIRSVSLPYEPGSIFKAFTVAIALEEGAIKDGQVITNCTGHMKIGVNSIGEANNNSHGSVTPAYLMEQSCNIGSAVLALRVGSDKFIDWAKKFGFGQKTGIELPHESGGLISSDSAGSRIRTANIGFGQGLTATGIQLAAAYGVFMNDGKWVSPHLIKAVANDKGKFEPVPPPETREVCSAETAKLMRRYMEGVVLRGSGKGAAVPGYRIGGKSGTAQKAVPGIGYKSGKYYASFVGVTPLDDSYNDGEHLVILVMIDEPRGAYYGGAIASPVVGEIAQAILPTLVGPAKAGN